MKELIGSNEYMVVEKIDNGLLISITDIGREFLIENKDKEYFANFDDMYESIMCNSDILFHWDLGVSGFGLTSSEGFTVGYYYDDNGELVGDGDVYYSHNYAMCNFIDKLIDEGKYSFTKA